MINLRQYQVEKNQLLTIYDDLLKNFQLEEKTLFEIKQFKKNLVSEKFIVSVCGQINVGKSTFLNDLLFEENILPTKEVVETAKLTTIQYGELPSYEVVFYNEEEWNLLKKERFVNSNGENVINDNSGEPYSVYEFLIKQSINKLISSTGNLSIEREILEQQSISGTNFHDLKQYVSADGQYTAFVKTVNIFYPSELLKDIVIVDTPGTNDPNTIRSKLTENWIGKSDAVIFLMYGGQALTAQDEEFILKYLLPVPSDKIIIALSKIDTVENYQRPKNYVEKNLRKLEQFQKAIEHKTIYPISPMYSLYPKLYRKSQSGEVVLSEKELEEIEFQLFERGEQYPELIEKKGFMPEFREAIETHLLNNKGEAIIKSHKQKIASIFQLKLRDLVIQKENVLKKLGLSQLSRKEILAKELELSDYINKIQQEEKNVVKKKQDFFNKLENFIHQSLRDMFESIGERTLNQIEHNKSLDYLINNISWFFKNECETYIYGEFSRSITKSLNSFKKELEDLLLDLRRKVTTLNVISTVSIEAMFSDIAYMPIIKGIEQKITQKLSSSMLEKLDRKFWIFRLNKTQTKVGIKTAVNELISTDEADGLRQGIIASILSDLQMDINIFFGSLLNQIKEELVSVNDHLKTVLDEKVEKGPIEEELKKQIKEMEQKIQSIEKQKLQILGNLSLV